MDFLLIKIDLYRIGPSAAYFSVVISIKPLAVHALDLLKEFKFVFSQ